MSLDQDKSEKQTDDSEITGKPTESKGAAGGSGMTGGAGASGMGTGNGTPEPAEAGSAGKS